MKCFKSGQCVNCLTEECVQAFEFLQALEFQEILGEGIQSTVIGAIYKNQKVAVKIAVFKFVSSNNYHEETH